MTQEQKSAEEQAVAKAFPSSVARVGNAGPKGFDDVDVTKEIIMPRLAILQQMSDMVVNGKGMMGDVANSLSKENLGKEVVIIPLFMFKTRARFDVGQGLVMLSRDNVTVTFAKNYMTKDGKLVDLEQYIGKSVEEVPGINFEGSNAPTFCMVYNFVALIRGKMNEFPICLSLMRTGEKAAKQFISMARTTNEDFFSRAYKVTAKKVSNDKGTFAVAQIECVGRTTDEEYATAGKQYDIFYRAKSTIAVDLEEEPLAKEDHSQ